MVSAPTWQVVQSFAVGTVVVMWPGFLPVMVMPSWVAPSWQLAHGVSVVMSACLTVVCGVKEPPIEWQFSQLVVVAMCAAPRPNGGLLRPSAWHPPAEQPVVMPA